MTGPSSRAPLLLVLVWVGGLVAATSVGLLAVRLVAAQVGDPAIPPPLSAVAAASAGASAAPTLPARPSPTAQAPPAVTPTPAAGSVQATTRTFATAAGTVGVQCPGTALRLLYATPAQGWALDERSVAGAQAEVRFESAGTRLRLRLSCAGGVPQLVEQRTDQDGDDRDDDDRGRDDGGDDADRGDDGGDDGPDQPDDD